ncbi:bestrophin family protein [Pseudomonas syringae]|uniref:Effector protein n=1 Tax=Pseudomonas syringae TaxID=317 RepID=A0A9Q4A4G7_PSESX|nr:bestrophin family ion channel [Pseudomonas syringae]MCF5467684.1 effector protein [Pseudomonas syringae]MCF5474586.1 effector protein [Pseudomonas syringae]MCF5484104.1 effector protein [Pseudomonas syringae]MCF5487879.1 effector protein [Pseudomonas syringae]MCF5494825.1 effector protein [Pseudomonas syringae]
MPGPFEKKWRCISRTVTYVGWSLFWLLLWDVAVTMDFMLIQSTGFIDLPLMPLTLLCSALIVLISFRNSSAYNRWWEARTLWGAMVNSSRSFGRQVLTLIDGEHDDCDNPVKATLFKRHVAYLRALRAHLKGNVGTAKLEGLLSLEEIHNASQSNNFPNDILNGSAAIISQEFAAGRIDSIRLARLESTMVELSNCQGGMERIANTPLPYPYVYFPRLFSTLFCIIMPLSMVTTLGWFTPAISTVVGCMLLAMDRIGTDLQAPFGNSQHRIRMEDLCNTIEKNLRSMFDAPEKQSLLIESQGQGGAPWQMHRLAV